MKKLTRKNPNDIYSLWLDLSSKDKSKARKAALALRQQFAGKSKFSDFWPIIREERDLTVDEIKAKIESVIKKTSGARVNPVRKIIRNPDNNQGKKILDEIKYRYLDRRIDSDGDISYEYGVKTQNYLETIPNKDLKQLKIHLNNLVGVDLGGYRENYQQRLISRMVESEINNRKTK